MAQYKVVITDFGSPENELEANELKNSGLDIELVRLNAKTPQELLPHVVDADGLIVQWTNISREVIEALQNGAIAGAALDVFENEPHVPEVLRAMDNVVLTPHMASGTWETRRAMADLAFGNLAAHFAGQPLLTPVPV